MPLVIRNYWSWVVKISDDRPAPLGTGKGTSVLELIHIFESVNEIKLNYKIGARRKGDVIIAYANTSKIKGELKWSTKHSLESALKSAWRWEKNINKNE